MVPAPPMTHLAAPAAAEPAAALAARAAALVGLINGEAAPESLFAPSMLAQVPATTIAAIAADLRSRYGRAVGVGTIEPAGAAGAVAELQLERATVRARFSFDPQPGGRMTGLFLEPPQLRNDSVQAIAAELKALPGRTSFAVATLGESGAAPVAGVGEDEPVAIGSAFKLFLLAELVRQVRAGERHWSDVVPLDRRSLPSGILQDWPAGSPMTLHSLAALMISRSDNSAADTLLHRLGRDRVEALLPKLGLRSPERDRPFLSTMELFAIKADPALTARWAAADESARRAMLPMLAGAKVDPAALAGPPRAIDRIEWFASAADLVRTMDWLRRNADETGLALLAINPGLGPQAREGFDYLGYKGGSEAGVIEMTFLLRRKDGSWRAVAAAWNDPAAAVDEARFGDLVARLVALQR